MKKELSINFLLNILFILLIVCGCILFFEYENRNTIDSLYINDGSNLKRENSVDSSNNSFVLNHDCNEKEYMDSSVSNGINNIDNYKNNVSYTEEDVINHFELMNDEISESESYKEKFKDYFITIIDFIFYDKDIKGYTFEELSGIAKIEVISFALKIDSKLEEYVPNYKENISSVSGKVYNNIKERLVSLYMDISTNICDNNVEECNTVKIVWTDIKDVCGIGWDFVKNIASDGIKKLKLWYEIYSGKK